MRSMNLKLAVLVAVAAVVASANAPAGRYVVSTDTVVDTVTHLTWQRNASTTLRWADAQTTCANLAPAGTWRLPTIKELRSLVDPRMAAPSSSFDPVFAGPSTTYWTATTTANQGSAMAIAFDNSTLSPGGRSFWRLTQADARGYFAIGSARCVHP